MIIKFFGMAIVLVSSSLIGFSYAERMASRERSLATLADAAGLMHSELLYSRLAIGDIIFCVTPRLDGAVREFFDTMRHFMQRGESASEAWINSIEQNAGLMQIKYEDAELIKNSAHLLEVYDFDEQERALTSLGERLSLASQKAALSAGKNSRIVKMLGVYCGILACIIIF